MTVRKTDEDLKTAAPSPEGPVIVGAEASDKAEVDALKRSYPKAKMIEKLPSGAFAVRFRRKATKYWRPSRARA